MGGGGGGGGGFLVIVETEKGDFGKKNYKNIHRCI